MGDSKIDKYIRFNKNINFSNLTSLGFVIFFLIMVSISAFMGKIMAFSVIIIFWSVVLMIYQYWRWKFHNPNISSLAYNLDLTNIKKIIFVDIFRTSLIIGLMISSFILSTSTSSMNIYQFIFIFYLMTISWLFSMVLIYITS